MMVGIAVVVALGGLAAYLLMGLDEENGTKPSPDGFATAGMGPITGGEPGIPAPDAGTLAKAPAEKPDAGAASPVPADPGSGASAVAKAADTRKAPEVRIAKGSENGKTGWKKKRKRKKRKRVQPPPRTPPEKAPAKDNPKVAVANKKGKLEVRTKPWTEVSVDGTSYGATPLDGPIELTPGLHVVQLSNRTEGIRHRERIHVKAGKTRTIRKVFTKGFLKVYVKPFGDVYVNGQRKGLTPLDKPIGLYEGTHTLRVYCSRTGKEQTRQVHIEGGKTSTVKMDLK
jgi:hypothetical protein